MFHVDRIPLCAETQLPKQTDGPLLIETFLLTSSVVTDIYTCFEGILCEDFQSEFILK